jgi:hypothetical protein
VIQDPDDPYSSIWVDVLNTVVAGDEIIPAPKKPTEKEYAGMSLTRRENLQNAWDQIESEGFVCWRYDQTGKNVQPGTDKPTDDVASSGTVYIHGAFRPSVTFYGLGGKVVDQFYVDEGQTFAQSGATVPTAPTEKGYTFVNWYYGSATSTGDLSLFDKDRVISSSESVIGRYTGTEWTISYVDPWYVSGYTECPVTVVTLGGEDGLELYEFYDGETGQIGYRIEAPEGVTADPNSVQWVYNKDGKGWQSLNEKLDYLDSNQQWCMQCTEDLTVAGLKELIDAKQTKTTTYVLAPEGKEKDPNAQVTLKVIVDPSNVNV